MKNLTWQNPEQLFVAQELINKVKSKCCGIKDGLERGRRLLKAAEHLSKEILKSRTLIDWIIYQYDEADDDQKGATIDNLVKFFSSLNKEKAEQIEKAKGQRGGDTKETIINRLLNNFYEQYTQSQSTSTDE